MESRRERVALWPNEIALCKRIWGFVLMSALRGIIEGWRDGRSVAFPAAGPKKTGADVPERGQGMEDRTDAR